MAAVKNPGLGRIVRPGPKKASFTGDCVRHQAIRRMMIDKKDQNTNTGITAIVDGAYAAKNTVRTGVTAVQVAGHVGRHFRCRAEQQKRIGNGRMAGTAEPGGKASPPMPPSVRVQTRKLKQGGLRRFKPPAGGVKPFTPKVKIKVKRNGGNIVRAAARGAGSHLARNAGIATLETMRSDGVSDSSGNAIYTAAQTTMITVGAARDTKAAVKSGVSAYRFVRNRVNKHAVKGAMNLAGINQHNSAARMVSQRAAKLKRASKVNNARQQAAIARNGARMAGSAVSRVGQMLAAHPAALQAIAVCAAVLLLLLMIAGMGNAMGTAVTDIVLMDEQTTARYQQEMETLDQAFDRQVEDYKNTPGYDEVRIDYMSEEGEALHTNWPELISLMAVKFEQNLIFSGEEKSYMYKLFHKMRVIKTRTERYYCAGCCTCGDRPLHCHGDHVRLVAEVYSYGMDDIMDGLGFDEVQIDWARHLAASDWQGQIFEGAMPPNGGLSPEELLELIQSAPATNATREQIRTTALSLVGKVPYFWGGKSSAGWNPRWGTSVEVTASGNSTTGTYQPFGLDCSGFVDWVYKTAGVGNLLSAGGTSYQWTKTYAISEADLQPGDLVFKQIPGTAGTNHVGIYVGESSNGKNLYCHCAWSQGVTVDSYAGFKYYRRPLVHFGE